jgi:TnpA family transposase
MKRYWSKEKLEDFWTFLPEEKALLGNKTGIQKFLYLLILKYYSIDYSFPTTASNIPLEIIDFGMKEYAVRVTISDIEAFLNNYDSYIKYQKEIRNHYGIKIYSDAEHGLIEGYIYKIALEIINQDKVEAEIISLFKKHKIEKPADAVIKNLARESINKVETYLFKHISDTLDKNNSNHKDYIDKSLLCLNNDFDKTIISFLKQDSGKSNLDSISNEIKKLQTIAPLELDSSIIPDDISPNILKFYKRKIINDTPEQIRAKPEYIRYPLMVIFCYLKRQEVIDNLVDHLCNLVHKIKKKGQKVENSLNNQIGKLSHGLDALYRMAKVAYDQPEDKIKNAIYPVVPRGQLEKLLKIRHIQKNMKDNVHKTLMRSYSGYYKKQIFEILNSIEFISNNQEILEALILIKKYASSKCEYYPVEEPVIVDNLLTKADKEFVYGAGNKKGLVKRKDYEYFILKLLRDKLKNKEIWIDDSFKYKDPATDLPKDFDENKEFYYNLLNQPILFEETEDFLKKNLNSAASNLDNTIKQNPHVKITKRNDKPWIKLSPLQPQPEPLNLEKIKEIINKHWDSLSLLDVLKEVDLREGFTASFTSSGNREILTKEEIQKRLILCLFAIGTNTGLTRISSGSVNNVTLEELKYIKRKFINQGDLREAITKVVNAIFSIRDASIWGEATTACASDSRKFISWDQNLMSEWHARYKGPGVMIYWHVSKQSICIYSQLKTCSSSEVASMLQGIVSQSSDMLIESQYVDSHGKSELGFAISYLLGFKLLPRYADIGTQKIYLPSKDYKCKNIKDITTRAINWDLIREHYDTLIKYVVGIKIGTVTAESIIRQFSRSNFQNPIFKAFTELGKAIKSIFLCRYLSSIELRQEIHSGLNIVENWNSLNDFIFYGKKSEIASNSHDEQEYSMLCLHLIQVCLAYINTLLIQEVLANNDNTIILTFEDRRGITPLFHSHINPYGIFELDMNKRILVSGDYV